MRISTPRTLARGARRSTVAPSPSTDTNWPGIGFTSKMTVETVRDVNDADELARALLKTGEDNPHQPVMYVKLPDGSLVYGYDVEAETLTDGSVVYNLVLRAS